MILFTLRVLNQIILGYSSPSLKALKNGGYNVRFRCYPIDMDTNLHMNNASYIRVAELARWRAFPSSGMMGSSIKNGWLFIVVEQKATYMKQIQPFQSYVVSTTMHVADNKWLNYKHTFQKYDDDALVNCSVDKQQVYYAVVETRAVLKEKSGKTIRPGELENLKSNI